MDVTLAEIEGALRSYKEALEKNPMSEKDKKDCISEIEKLEKMRQEALKE